MQAGFLLAIYWPGVSPEVLGPFRPAAYLTAYAYIALPNAFVATAIQFLLALRSGRALAGYLGSLFLLFMGIFVATFVHWVVKQGLGAPLDPIGLHFIVEDLAHEWTPTERNTRLLALEGFLLTNRLLWTGVGVLALAAAWLGFRFAHRAGGAGWWRRGRRRRVVQAPPPSGLGVAASAPVSVPRVPGRFGLAVQAHKTLAIAWSSFRALARSWAGLALLGVVPLMTVLVVLDQMAALGVPLVPTTARVLMELTGGLSAELAAAPGRWVIVPLFLVFFAGELVWRERDAGLGEITDAMPGSEWSPLLGKLLGLGLVLALFTALQAAAGMLAQTILGHHDFEVALYLKVLFGLQLPEYLLFAVLALAVHVVVDQKYVGHLAAVLAYAFIAALAAVLGIEHDLLVYGRGPAWSYTEMRGFGASIGPWLWLELYWAAWALLLAVGAKLLWVRGRDGGLRVRLRLARHRLTRPTAWTAAAGAGLVLALGGFVFYNTNVVNEYRSTSEGEELRAEYERRYRRYEDLPQPRLAAADLRVEIHPHRRAVEIRAAYRLVNEGAEPIGSVHVATATGGAETRAMTFDRPATLAVRDEEHAYRIYDLETPLQPGEALRLDWEVQVAPRGFGHRGHDRSVVPNGSYFTNQAWFPAIGYQRFRELLAPAARRDHGLPPRPVLASVYEVEGREPAARGGGIAFEAVVGTDEDQVAVAPGALRRTWTEGGRRYFHYAASAPIGGEWAFFLTIVEHPAALGTGAHADPAMISHGQGFASWAPRDERGLDLPFYVMAHEMAHQWTVPYALAEGLPFLAEGLATYAAMQVVEEARGEAQLRRLLAFMRQPFPYRPIRHGEPLLRALDPYLSRRQGPFAMRALGEYVGQEPVNRALRRLIETHDAAGAPPATTLDLYRELQAVTPASHRDLLHDLFEVNAQWQLRTERASAEETEGGEWRVTLDVRARKVVIDEAGVETEVPLDEWIEIGVFGAGERGDELSRPLYVERHRIRTGEQTITLTVPEKPVLAGIDPYHVLDWEEGEDDDNIEGVGER